MREITRLKALKLIPVVVCIIGIHLAKIWFGWRLVLVLVILIWGNNLDQGDFTKQIKERIKELKGTLK